MFCLHLEVKTILKTFKRKKEAKIKLSLIRFCRLKNLHNDKRIIIRILDNCFTKVLTLKGHCRNNFNFFNIDAHFLLALVALKCLYFMMLKRIRDLHSFSRRKRLYTMAQQDFVFFSCNFLYDSLSLHFSLVVIR